MSEMLLGQIREAFRDVSYPGDGNLVYDNSGEHLECEEVKAAFRGKAWDEVPPSDLARHSSALFFFTPDAYRFYLPAWMAACLRNYNEVDTLPGAVAFSLIPPSDSRDTEAYNKRLSLFSHSQLAAIRNFLTFMKANHGADDALGQWEEALAAVSRVDGQEDCNRRKRKRSG